MLVGAVATAQPGPPEPASCPAKIAAAARLDYERLHYAEAVASTSGVEACLDGSPGAFAEALRWRAQALGAQGRSEEAIKAFALVAVVEPAYALDPFVSPKFHELFQRGRMAAARTKPMFVHWLPTRTDAGATQARAELFGGDEHTAVQLRCYVDGVPVVLEAAREQGGVYQAGLPSGAEGHCRVSASGGEQQALSVSRELRELRLPGRDVPGPSARSGDVPLPPPVLAKPPAEDPVRGAAWVPAVAGGVLALAGGGALVGAHLRAAQLASGDPGIVGTSQLDSALAGIRTTQQVGVGLVIAGGACLGVAAVMAWAWPAAEAPSVAVSSDGHGAALLIGGRF